MQSSTATSVTSDSFTGTGGRAVISMPALIETGKDGLGGQQNTSHALAGPFRVFDNTIRTLGQGTGHIALHLRSSHSHGGGVEANRVSDGVDGWRHRRRNVSCPHLVGVSCSSQTGWRNTFKAPVALQRSGRRRPEPTSVFRPAAVERGPRHRRAAGSMAAWLQFSRTASSRCAWPWPRPRWQRRPG